MKLVRFLMVCLLIFTFTTNTTNIDAQNRRNRFDWDKFRAEKVSFLTDKMELTPEEAQKFWPIYNQFEKEKSENHKARRNIERQFKEENGNLSDKEITELLDQMVATFQADTELFKKYNKELLKVLPPRKVLILYNMEGEFRMHMLKKYRSGHHKGN